MKRDSQTDTKTENEGAEFNAMNILNEKEKQEEILRKNAALVPETAYEQNSIAVISGAYKLAARPKTGEMTFIPELTQAEKAAGKVARPIKYKNINAILITGPGRLSGKPGQVRVEILPLDWLRLIQNAMADRKFVSMINLMADEERTKAISTENWTVPL